jgi:hypothetical protein
MPEDNKIIKILTSYEEDGKRKRIVYSNQKNYKLSNCTLVIEEEQTNTFGEKSFVIANSLQFRIDGHTSTSTLMLYRLLDEMFDLESEKE